MDARNMAESPFHVPFATPLPQHHPQAHLRDVSMSMHLGSPYRDWRSQQLPDLTQRLMSDHTESTPFGKRYGEEDSYSVSRQNVVGGSMRDRDADEQGTMEGLDIEEESWLDRVVQLYASEEPSEDSTALSEFVLGCVMHEDGECACAAPKMEPHTNLTV
jgi:hypothetical protein